MTVAAASIDRAKVINVAEVGLAIDALAGQEGGTSCNEHCWYRSTAPR